MWPVVQFYFFPYFLTSLVSVSVWIPSSASTLQVGFMYGRTSPTPEERFKSQGRRRTTLEVPFSGVPLGSLAGF